MNLNKYMINLVCPQTNQHHKKPRKEEITRGKAKREAESKDTNGHWLDQI